VDLDGGGDEQWGLPLASATHGDRLVCWVCGGIVWAQRTLVYMLPLPRACPPLYALRESGPNAMNTTDALDQRRMRRSCKIPSYRDSPSIIIGDHIGQDC
jgi:hypothetical protein